ncbi:MAG: hypothetical protein GY715_14185 [Planctomycetes bacterium]|nr:hypothetical protein [Planctomycetota bacterium]
MIIVRVSRQLMPMFFTPQAAPITCISGLPRDVPLISVVLNPQTDCLEFRFDDGGPDGSETEISPMLERGITGYTDPSVRAGVSPPLSSKIRAASDGLDAIGDASGSTWLSDFGNDAELLEHDLMAALDEANLLREQVRQLEGNGLGTSAGFPRERS